MTAANRPRRSPMWAAVLGTALAAGLVPAAAGAESSAATSRLESPMADMAILGPTDGATQRTTPMLLVLDAERLTPNSARLSILRRASSWERVTVLDVDLERDDLDARWLVGLGDDRFALIGTSPANAPGTGHAIVVGIEVREEAGAPTLVQTGRARIDQAIEDAGAADVDGLGTDEIVLGLRPSFDASGSCGTTSLLVLDSATSAVRRSIDLPGRLGRGVIGRWDVAPGDDLLVNASAQCPPGGPGQSRLVAVRLRDGTETTVAELGASRDLTIIPPPLRLGSEEDGPDHALAALTEGLAVVDAAGGKPERLFDGPTIPLVAGPDAGASGDADRIGWLSPDGLHAERLHRSADGRFVASDRTSLDRQALPSDRWDLLTSSATTDVLVHGLSSAWFGAIADEGCPDLVLPGAILPCGVADLREGATWVATRLVAAMPIEGRPAGLVAAGVAWDPAVGLPTSPTPLAAGPAGWWRHGPSTPFVLSEVRGSDVVYFQDFPSPKATIEAATASDGSTILPGFTGTRMFVSIAPLAGTEEGTDVAPSKIEGLLEAPEGDGVVRTVRVPVPPGNESGRDGSFTTLELGAIGRTGTDPTTRWAMRVVPVNDWGEVGFPVARTIARDAVGPTLNLETPFTSPVWPLLARLPGRAEPGSTVGIDGAGPLEVDDRGRFTVVTRLAPWPQTIRLTATDLSGNTSIGEFSVVGGVDYRQFPWALIAALALLGIVAARGLAAAGRDRGGGVEATAWSLGILDDASMPEIEELPPGHGLARR
jgi:hypothetical protein